MAFPGLEASLLGRGATFPGQDVLPAKPRQAARLSEQMALPAKPRQALRPASPPETAGGPPPPRETGRRHVRRSAAGDGGT